ncbi:MAG: methanethiol S-methyltransferase [Planctomycetota bacterium]
MRFFILGYGLFAYLGFHASFVYLIAFLANLLVPTTVAAGGPQSGLATSVLINVGLITLFGVQHGVMARQPFKRWLRTLVPPAIERSTFVLATVAVLALLYWQWRPLPDVVWQLDGVLATVAWSVFGLGWLIAVLSTFLIDHFELFGVKQTIAAFRGRAFEPPRFAEKGFYRYMRHPLMFGMLLSFWSVPTMTVGGLVFAATYTVYILIALQIEERDLLSAHGPDYASYQRRVPMLLPLPRRSPTPVENTI